MPGHHTEQSGTAGLEPASITRREITVVEVSCKAIRYRFSRQLRHTGSFGLSIRKTFPPMAKAACLSYAPGRHGQHKRGRETRKCKKPFLRSAYPYRQRIPQDSNLSKPASQAGIAEGENSIMSDSASRSMPSKHMPQ